MSRPPPLVLPRPPAYIKRATISTLTSRSTCDFGTNFSSYIANSQAQTQTHGTCNFGTTFSLLFADSRTQTEDQAEKDASEQLRQEVRRLRSREFELSKRCRENDETVKKVCETAEQENRRMEAELKALRTKNQAQVEALEVNARMLEKGREQEMQLREAIDNLTKRLERQSDEQQVAGDGREKPTIDVTKQQLMQTSQKLKESEQYASDMQKYSEGLEEVNASLQQQVQGCNSQRDEVILVAEELRDKFVSEAQRVTGLEIELAKLRQDHSALQANHATLRLKSTKDLGNAGNLQRQLEDSQRRLQSADEALEECKATLQVRQQELSQLKLESEELRAERDALNTRVDQLLESVTENQQFSTDNLLTRHRSPRP